VRRVARRHRIPLEVIDLISSSEEEAGSPIDFSEEEKAEEEDDDIFSDLPVLIGVDFFQ
jgi:hypothetical protein